MALRLETFAVEGEAPAPESPPLASEDRLSAYDDGYSAGWDDAIAEITAAIAAFYALLPSPSAQEAAYG